MTKRGKEGERDPFSWAGEHPRSTLTPDINVENLSLARRRPLVAGSTPSRGGSARSASWDPAHGPWELWFLCFD